jgi:hypothetical protein
MKDTVITPKVKTALKEWALTDPIQGDSPKTHQGLLSKKRQLRRVKVCFQDSDEESEHAVPEVRYLL